MIHLVLYHLMVTQEGRDGFFRWNEEICGCIEVWWVWPSLSLLPVSPSEELAGTDASAQEDTVVAQHSCWHSLCSLSVSVPVWLVLTPFQVLRDVIDDRSQAIGREWLLDFDLSDPTGVYSSDEGGQQRREDRD